MSPHEVIRRRFQREQQERDRIQTQTSIDGALATIAAGVSKRVTRSVAQALLLGSPWMFNGQCVRVSGKSVGAGVWEVWRDKEVAS